jgi:hypothetical protein
VTKLRVHELQFIFVKRKNVETKKKASIPLTNLKDAASPKESTTA